MKEAVPCDSSSLMWLSTTWCDFLYRRRAMGMMWLFPHDVTWARRSYYVLFAEVVPAYLTFSLHGGNVPLVIPLHTSFGWEGRSFSLFDGLGWRRGAVAQGVPHFMLWSMMALGPALDNSWIRGRSGGRSGVVRGVVRLYFQHLFSFVFFVCSFFYLLLFLSHRLLLLLFSLFPSFTQSYSFSNQTIVAEWLFVMQSSAGRRVVCSARGGLSRVCYNGTLYPSNEGNPLVFWWIAVTLLWPGRGDFSASGLSTFKKIALTSALDCRSYFIAWWGISSDQLEPPYFETKWNQIHPAWGISNSWMVWCLCHGKSHHLLDDIWGYLHNYSPSQIPLKWWISRKHHSHGHVQNRWFTQLHHAWWFSVMLTFTRR